MADDADSAAGHDLTLPEDVVLMLLNEESGDDEVFVTGALQGSQPVITGGLPFATEGMRVQTLSDPVR